jgi:tellurite resistance protein TehA-like permease
MTVTSPASGAATSAEPALATMHPAYFAMVMATGIVSIAALLLGYRWIAVPLFVLNIVFYVVLWVLTLQRIARHRDRVIADLMHHGRSVGFFTIVAATCVLGSQVLLIAENWRAAAVLWGMGIVFWATITYSILTILTVKQAKPSLADGINGGWLVSVVAAQSVAVLGAQLSGGFTNYGPHVLVFSVIMWLGGGMLYIWIISLIFYRYTFFTLSPGDLAPPYWINMGAVAISTLAGAMLIAAAPRSPLLAQLLPFVRGLTLMFWATATWWIPMLVILGIWRHVFRRFPLRYDPLYWGAVFPLGMYTACTFRLANAIDAPFLLAIPRAFFFVALAAWTLTTTGLVFSLIRKPPSDSRTSPSKGLSRE